MRYLQRLTALIGLVSALGLMLVVGACANSGTVKPGGAAAVNIPALKSLVGYWQRKCGNRSEGLTVEPDFHGQWSVQDSASGNKSQAGLITYKFHLVVVNGQRQLIYDEVVGRNPRGIHPGNTADVTLTGKGINDPAAQLHVGGDNPATFYPSGHVAC